MAFLITYAEQHVAADLRQKLASTSPTIYLPLKRIRPVALTTAEIATIRCCHYVILTSPAAVDLYLAKYRSLNPEAIPLVLSQKMAEKLRVAGVKMVWSATAENAGSLADLITPTIENEACLLRGDCSVISQLLSATIDQVIIYKNEWDQVSQQVAIARLTGQIFTKVLVTSPSSYDRLAAIIKQLPTAFANVTFYTLGETTAKAIPTQNVIVAKGPGVLQDAILKMCDN